MWSFYFQGESNKLNEDLKNNFRPNLSKFEVRTNKSVVRKFPKRADSCEHRIIIKIVFPEGVISQVHIHNK